MSLSGTRGSQDSRDGHPAAQRRTIRREPRLCGDAGLLRVQPQSEAAGATKVPLGGEVAIHARDSARQRRAVQDCAG